MLSTQSTSGVFHIGQCIILNTSVNQHKKHHFCVDYRTMLLLSDTYSMVPILVHECQPHACNQEPEMILQRARLYRVLLPPDQLNSFGYYDGTLDAAFLSRYDRKKKGGRADLRASTKQMTMPPPGESAALLLCHSAPGLPRPLLTSPTACLAGPLPPVSCPSLLCLPRFLPCLRPPAF